MMKPAQSAPMPEPPEFARRYLLHHFRKPFNAMHEFSFEQYRQDHEHPLPDRRGRRLAIAAPRGSAKSTVHSLLLPVMDILAGRERHIVIISATQQQAVRRLANIAHEIRNNALILRDFFGGELPEITSNRGCLTVGRVRVEAYGSGSEMRGISHGEYRPTRIILDDVEASRNAIASYRRQQLLSWYDEVVENLGDTYTHITIVGTILHRSSLLSTLLERPGYRGECYRSIIAWSPRTDLWNLWQQLYVDLTDPHREKSAEVFFERNRDALMADTRVLWPEKEDYLELYRQLTTIGRPAFFKEKQNQPFSNDQRVFDTSRWTRFIAPDGRIQIARPPLAKYLLEAGDDPTDDRCADTERHSFTGPHDPRPMPGLGDLKYFGFLDPALGRQHTRDGDYAAIVTVGRDGNGICYVIDVWMQRAEPSAQISRIFELHREFQYTLFGYEANGFQETLGVALDREIKAREQAGRPCHLSFRKTINTENKRARICCLEPSIMSGSIRFAQNLPEEFYTQADEFGSTKTHDDALDALAGCMEMIRKLDNGISGIRTVGRREGGRF